MTGEGGGGVNRFADRRNLAFKSVRIADFCNKLSGFANLKDTVDHGSAANIGSDSGFFLYRSSDCGSDH